MYLHKRKICICCYDAGSADFIMCYLKNNFKKLNNFRFYLAGPAKKIFSSSFKKIKQIKKKELYEYDKFICSTGWSNFNLNVMFNIIKRKKYLISIVDDINYLDKRFFSKNKLVIPNEIWTITKKQIISYFSQKTDKKIKIIKMNEKKKYYLKFKRIAKKENSLLIVENALKSFTKYMHLKKKLQKKISLRNRQKDLKKILNKYKKIDNIIIRPHPKQKLTKVDLNKIKSNKYMRVSISKNILIEKDLINSRYVLSYSKSVAEIAKYSGNCVF